MITLTPSASDFVAQSLQATGETDLALRIAAYPDNTNHCYNYQLGFDNIHKEDLVIDHKTFKIVLHKEQRQYIEDATLDYVEMDDGTMNLIVMNPNDPSYVPPKKDKK